MRTLVILAALLAIVAYAACVEVVQEQQPTGETAATVTEGANKEKRGIFGGYYPHYGGYYHGYGGHFPHYGGYFPHYGYGGYFPHYGYYGGYGYHPYGYYHH
ncbi:neuropeptide-like protein 33 [Ischnura elegans]|uniref:neuropeptide-like protein 33 n=1 Tax=Ischnura elegans TaxID=197161 RepID=UPI001ED869E0|nr:neuropeptide-like protein 33 [Ischnura elegans]